MTTQLTQAQQAAQQAAHQKEMARKLEEYIEKYGHIPLFTWATDLPRLIQSRLINLKDSLF